MQPGAEMFVVTDTASLWMIAAVAEEDLGKLRIGMPVRVSVKAHPDRVFSGRLTKFGEQLDPATRTIQARVELPNSGGPLKPEMYATAEFETTATRSAMIAPEIALQEVKGQTVLFVERSPGHFEAVAVETGRSTGGMVEIAQGLEPGARVAVKGAFILKSQLLRKSLDEE